jgi:hypothetical protein
MKEIIISNWEKIRLSKNEMYFDDSTPNYSGFVYMKNRPSFNNPNVSPSKEDVIEWLNTYYPSKTEEFLKLIKENQS